MLGTPPSPNPITASVPEDDILDSRPTSPSSVSGPKDITIYGYPVDGFAPTDFHISTYYGDPISGQQVIFIIGGLGYSHSASRHRTDVYQLNLSDFSIQHLETSGANPPGGTHEHVAELVHGTSGTEPTIKIGAKDGRIFSLLLNTLEWISNGEELSTE